MEILGLFGVLLVLLIPILAIVAIVRVQRFAELFGEFRPQDLLARMYALEQRLSSLEKMFQSRMPPGATLPAQDVARPRAVERPESVSPPVHPVPSVSPAFGESGESPAQQQALPNLPPLSTPPPFHSSGGKTSSSRSLEILIAGRWFNRIGILALIASVTWFLKYAFDNNWIGPSGRVGIGILLGATMLPWSNWLLKRGYSYFSEGIAGLGAVVLYLSVWAGCQFYTLYSRDVGFFAMIVVTAAMAAVALGRNSQRIALLSLMGGFLTPLMVSSGRDEQVVLFTYILLLSAGMLLLDLLRDWRILGPLSLALTQAYFWGWYDRFYNLNHLERTIVFATLFFLLYAVLPLLRILKHSRYHRSDLAVALVNSFAYLGTLYVLLWPQDRWPLTLFVIALGAAHVAIARLIPATNYKQAELVRALFAGMALTFATLAIPIRLDGKWISLAFAVEGAILVWTGFRSVAGYLARAGYLLLFLAAARLLLFPLPAGTFLLNERFWSYLLLMACFGVAVYAARKFPEAAGTDKIAVSAILVVGINAFALLALSLELWDFFGRGVAPGINVGLGQHLALTLLWTGYATVLILIGVNRHIAFLRWQAIALFGLVVVKVFLYDSSYLDRFYRIVAFFILGLVLMVISFLYQRRNVQGQSPT